MSTLEPQSGRGRQWICALCTACLLLLYAIGGTAWRAWRFESRGIERPRHEYVERRPGIKVDLAQYDADGLDRALSDVSSLGFTWLRQRFPWRAIEPAPGVYDWEQWGAVVEAADSYGLALIAVLDAPPAWAASGDEFPLPCRPPVREDAYARFVSTFAQRYGALIDYYQVWDEPNLSQSWGGGHVQPCGYAVLLEAAYPAIHGADPTAWVLGGGLAPTQAPGPDDLNDLVYLRQLYAQGGGGYFDILATKPYGFWSGPEDRRVHSDVLNYSRVIAQRERTRVLDSGDKPVWAVEWGWNVLPEGWAGEAPPWGSDTISVQHPRILDAVVRARTEWPWMGVKCWAEYQPDVRNDDPRWGFALRDRDGAPTALYATLQDAVRLELRIGKERASGAEGYAAPVALHYGLLLALVIGGSLDAFVLWRRSRCGDAARRLWRLWSSLGPIYSLLALVGLALLYATIPWPEWILLVLVLAAAILYSHPRWALLGAVFCIPFIYATKWIALGAVVLEVSPSETLLLLAISVSGLRALRAGDRRRKRAQRITAWPFVCWSALDGLWLLWVVLGALSPLIAPDAAYAWREWRLTMLGPMLVYLLLRWNTDPAVPTNAGTMDGGYSGGRDVLLAWLASGVIVALLGVGQSVAGAIVPAGDVGRVTSVYYSPNHLALYLERIWPLALVLALYGRLERRWRWVVWASLASLSAGLYLTYSRAAWLLAIPLAVLVMIVSYRADGGWAAPRRADQSRADQSRADQSRGGQSQGRRWWVMVVLVLFVLLVAVNVFLGRLTPFAALQDEIRLPVWQSTVEMIADHLWMGVGLDGFRFVYPRYMREEAWTEPLLYHPHNMWLDAAVRLGVPGLVVFALLVALCVVEAVRLRRETRAGHATVEYAIAVGCLAGLWAGLAHGVVDSGYFVGDLAWVLALVAGLVSRPCRESTQSRDV